MRSLATSYVKVASYSLDERMMLIWVQQVLKPYVKDAPIAIVPLLFLDLGKILWVKPHRTISLGVRGTNSWF